MPENSPAKARALRIPLGSHTSDRLARYRNLLAIAAVLACVGWILIGLRSPKTTANRYSPGPISQVHANLGCNSCHADSAPMHEETFLAHWKEGPADNVLWHRKSDTMCQSCHPVLEKSEGTVTFLTDYDNAQIDQPIPIAAHTDNQRIESVPSCAHCHAEHRGREIQLSKVADTTCIECHSDIEAIRSLEKPAIANHITRFDSDHPPFAALKADRGTLKFNHELHMTIGIRRKDENEKLVRTIDSYPDHAGRLDSFTTADGKIELECRFCHQPTDRVSDAQDTQVAMTPRSLAVGSFMSMPTYERDCQVCHSVDLAPPQNFDFERNLRIEHGASPTKISDALTLYFNLAANAPPEIKDTNSKEVVDPLEELPTRLRSIPELEKKLNRNIRKHFKLAKNTVRTSCLKCHFESEQDNGSGIPEIRMMPNHGGGISDGQVFATGWFEKGKFDHSAHRDVACTQCHEMDLGKNELIRQNIDVSLDNPMIKDDDGAVARPASTDWDRVSLDKPMIKDHDSCVACHQSPERVAAPSRPGPTNCIACHTYHDGGNRQ